MLLSEHCVLMLNDKMIVLIYYKHLKSADAKRTPSYSSDLHFSVLHAFFGTIMHFSVL